MTENNNLLTCKKLYDSNARRGYAAFLGVFFVFGSIAGTLSAESTFLFAEDICSAPSSLALIIRVLFSLVFLLVYGTSTVGWFLIPVLFFSLGFSSAIEMVSLLKISTGIAFACFIAGLPAFFSMTAFFIIGDHAMRKAVLLKDLYRTELSGAEPAFSGMMFVVSAVFIAGSVFFHYLVEHLIK